MNEDELQGRKAAREGRSGTRGMFRTMTSSPKSNENFDKGYKAERSRMQRQELNKTRKRK